MAGDIDVVDAQRKPSGVELELERLWVTVVEVDAVGSDVDGLALTVDSALEEELRVGESGVVRVEAKVDLAVERSIFVGAVVV